MIGKSGVAWGIGLHTIPSATVGPRKREGDGKTPAGAFALRGTYGYASAALPRAAMPYTPLDLNWQCVDDAASSHYAEILDRRTIAAPDWASAETMRRADVEYTWVVDVAHNPARTPGAGSCIFLHVWRGPDSATVGCTAMSRDSLERVLADLDPHAAPVFVLLPKAEYAALVASWGLPPPI